MAAQHNLSIVEAVETLSSIADLEFDREVGIAQKHEAVLGNEKIAYKTVHWLHRDDASSTVNLVRETFRVILHYLKQFYKKDYGHVTDQKTIDGIKTIMVLVGEAAKKLDNYTKIFHQKQRVTDFKEYKQLQEFYRTKIARQLDEDVLSKWVLGLALAKTAHDPALIAVSKKTDRIGDTKHVFVDLETVKKDTEYELFFIRKEDGSRFFSPRLLRNIKLVCDFGSYFGERKELDPLEHVKEWMDRVLHGCGKELLKALGPRLDRFFRETRKAKEHDLIEALNKALLALLMSSHANNLLRHNPTKSCTEYFEDFQGFLRDAMQTRTYQKWIAYPPKESNQAAFELIDIIQTLCRSLYSNLHGLEDVKGVVQGLIQQASSLHSRDHVGESKGLDKIWKGITEDYAAMAKLLKHHPNGPLLKVMEILDENSLHVFDSIRQHNLPNHLYDLYVSDHRFAFLRIPAPIFQEFINKASVTEEFKAFMRACSEGAIDRKHLLINLQDRTSWREHIRSKSLEDLQDQPSMNALAVVTLATDTDFYQQLTPYHQVHHAHEFMAQFKELLLDENAGYFFPASINRKELAKFITDAFKAIHRLFFSSKNVLSRESRLDFIEIFYMLLQLKIIEWLQPDSISLTCKDSIDSGEASSAELFAFIKLINAQKWSDADKEQLNFMIYAPALLIRERVMISERFNRMISALKAVENAKDEIGPVDFPRLVQENLSGLFSTPILQAQIH